MSTASSISVVRRGACRSGPFGSSTASRSRSSSGALRWFMPSSRILTSKSSTPITAKHQEGKAADGAAKPRAWREPWLTRRSAPPPDASVDRPQATSVTISRGESARPQHSLARSSDPQHSGQHAEREQREAGASGTRVDAVERLERGQRKARIDRALGLDAAVLGSGRARRPAPETPSSASPALDSSTCSVGPWSPLPPKDRRPAPSAAQRGKEDARRRPGAPPAPPAPPGSQPPSHAARGRTASAGAGHERDGRGQIGQGAAAGSISCARAARRRSGAPPRRATSTPTTAAPGDPWRAAPDPGARPRGPATR